MKRNPYQHDSSHEFVYASEEERLYHLYRLDVEVGSLEYDRQIAIAKRTELEFKEDERERRKSWFEQFRPILCNDCFLQLSDSHLLGMSNYSPKVTKQNLKGK